MRLFLIGLFGLLTLLTTNLHAMTAMELKEKCRGAELDRLTVEEAKEYNYCLGYVVGVADTTAIEQQVVDAKGQKRKSVFCIPDEGLYDVQMVLVVLKYIKAHPEQLNWSAVIVTHNALVGAFPCK